MDDAIFIAILLLFLGGCVAAVVFSVKKQGWLFTVRFGLLSLLVVVLLFDSAQTRMKFAIPLLGAVVVAWLWPQIAKQRNREQIEEKDSPTDKDG